MLIGKEVVVHTVREGKFERGLVVTENKNLLVVHRPSSVKSGGYSYQFHQEGIKSGKFVVYVKE